MKLFIHSDNGLGSARGDVDDGFAVAALLRSGISLTALASTYGNTPEPRAQENLRHLAAAAGLSVPVLRGAAGPGAGPTEASRFLRERGDGLTVVALGPLTDLAAALGPEGPAPWGDLVVVGGNLTSRGRWPPLWPFEFNFTLDRSATRRVLAAEGLLTVVPLDVCGRMRARYDDVARLPGPLGAYLARHARRWFRRALWLKGRRSVPVWDLVAAAVAAPRLVTTEPTTLAITPNGWVRFGGAGRPARVVTGFDGPALWRWLTSLL